MDIGEKCLTMLRAARSDQKKFAALLIVAKTLQGDKLPSLQRRQIFDAIGFTFLKRLLHSPEVPEGCSPNIYKSVAVALLSAFSTDPELAVHNSMNDCIPTFLEILKKPASNTEEEAMTDDVLQCFYCMALQEKGRRFILGHSSVPILVDLFVNDHYGCNQAFQVLTLLTYHCGSDTWSDNFSSFTAFMNRLAADFKSEDSMHKFELCQTLADILIKYPYCRSNPDDQWCLQIQAGLSDIFRSHLTKAQREPAFKLASMMVEKFGAAWFLEETESSKKFFALLVHLICIEVCMALEDKKTKEIIQEMDILSSCYSMLENIINIMIDETLWHWTERHSANLLPYLKNTFEIIITFLTNISQEWPTWETDPSESGVKVRELTFATVRLLASWLAEDSLLLNKNTCKILPFLLKLARESFIDAKVAQDQNFTGPIVFHVDLMRFLIPALCHLSADDNARAILIEESIHTVLLEYLEYQWTIIQKSPSVVEEIANLLSTLCGIFLNIVVMEPKVVEEQESYFKLLRFIMDNLPQLVGSKFLVLRANFAVLGFFITKHYHRRVKSCETLFYRFLSSSVKLLWDAYQVEPHGTTAGEDQAPCSGLVVAPEYRKHWPDLMELWYLGMQALATLLPLMPWLAQFIQESGWPMHIISALRQVSPTLIETNVRLAYQDFLCHLIKCSPQELAPHFREITDMHQICKAHNLEHLYSLLF